MNDDYKYWWGWIGQQDPEKVRWALTYLKKNDIQVPKDWLGRERYPTPSTSALTEAELEVLTKRMKNAWRAKRNKAKSTATKTPDARQALNVFISRKAKTQLKGLCRQLHTAQNEYIEQMILNASSFYDSHKSGMQDLKRNYREETTMLRERIEELEVQLQLARSSSRQQDRGVFHEPTPPPATNNSEVPRKIKIKRKTSVYMKIDKPRAGTT